MILLRQKIFGQYTFGGFDAYFDENGNLKPFTGSSEGEIEENRKRFEVYKKKFPKEWEEFVKNGYKDPKKKPGSSGSSSGSSSSYGSGSRSSGSSSSSSGSSHGGSSSSSGFDYDKWKREREQEDKKFYEELDRKSSKDTRDALKSGGLILGTTGAKLIHSGVKNSLRKNRKLDIDYVVGHNRNMKKSDRSIIESYKTKSKKDKQLLSNLIDDNKSEKEKKKSARRYTTRKILDSVTGSGLGGASLGSYSGGVHGFYKYRNAELGESNTFKSAKTGTLIGGGLGAVIGGINGGIQARKDIKRIRNSRDKDKELDRLKVGSGKMTETEFVKRHGGRE